MSSIFAILTLILLVSVTTIAKVTGMPIDSLLVLLAALSIYVIGSLVKRHG